MSDFIVAIPRRELLREVSEHRERRTVRRLRTVAQTYENYLPESMRGTSSVSWPGTHHSAAVLAWGNGTPVQLFKDFWSVATDASAGCELVHSLTLRGSALVHTKPVWGSYAAAFGERYSHRTWFWNTTPALEAIHYGLDSEYVYVSNRPLLVALCFSHGHFEVDINTEYAAEYLHFGYSISGNTPYRGVQTLDVEQCLVVHRGEIRFREVPRQFSDLPREHSYEEGAEALADALHRATRRTMAAIDGRELQLRLSGGKDSRLLAGLLRESGTSVDAITYGVESDVEVQLSRRIAQTAGFKHTVASPPSASGATLRQKVNQVIFECGGIPASEAHLGATGGAAPTTAGQPIMLGQWPLMKGGIAKVMRYPKGGIRSAVHKQGSRLLTHSVAEQFTAMLDDWLYSVDAASELEKLYLFARQFRSGRYLHSHITHYSRDAEVVYPISDMQVTATCDALTMAEKVSERTLFLAMNRIWPEVAGLPLHGSVWRFEAGGPADISGPGYASRTAAVPALVDSPIDSHVDDSSETTSISIADLSHEVTTSSRWPFLRSLLNEGIAQCVESAASGRAETPAGVSSREFYKMTWRVLLTDAWLSGEWREGLQA